MRSTILGILSFVFVMSSAYAADIQAPPAPHATGSCPQCEALGRPASQAHPTTITLVCVVWDQVPGRKAVLTFKSHGVIVRLPIVKDYSGTDGSSCIGAEGMVSYQVDEVDLCDSGDAVTGHHSIRKIPSIRRALQEAAQTGRGYIRMSLTGTQIDPNWGK